MKLFGGSFKTIDGKRWAVAFWAHSWEDAESIAETVGVQLDGMILGTFLDNNGEQLPLRSYFTTWEWDGQRIVEDD